MVKYNGYEITTRKFEGIWQATVLCNDVEVAKYMGFTRGEAIGFAKMYTEEVSPCPDLESPSLPDAPEDDEGETRLDIYMKYISECSYTRAKAKAALKKWDTNLSEDDLGYLLDGWQSSRDLLDCPAGGSGDMDWEYLIKIGLFVLVVCALAEVIN
jgi:hypothetical protein